MKKLIICYLFFLLNLNGCSTLDENRLMFTHSEKGGIFHGLNES
jgi:hypothetical protein